MNGASLYTRAPRLGNTTLLPWHASIFRCMISSHNTNVIVNVIDTGLPRAPHAGDRREGARASASLEERDDCSRGI